LAWPQQFKGLVCAWFLSHTFRPVTPHRPGLGLLASQLYELCASTQCETVPRWWCYKPCIIAAVQCKQLAGNFGLIMGPVGATVGAGVSAQPSDASQKHNFEKTASDLKLHICQPRYTAVFTAVGTSSRRQSWTSAAPQRKNNYRWR
jgi:hypothetical protein